MSVSAASDPVLVERSEGVLRVTLNRPEALNAVTTPMLRTVERALLDVEDDDSIRCVVLSGEGRGFCSGADIANKPGQEADVSTLDAGNAVVDLIRRLSKPVVSVATGPVAGIGVSLALAADLVVAADDAFFLLAFTNIGLMPDGGSTALVAASIGRARAMRMALLGERIRADQALEWGLVSHVVPAAEVRSEAEALASRLAGGATRAIVETKLAVNEATLADLDGAFRRERAGQKALFVTDDYAEGAAAFTERREARFTGR